MKKILLIMICSMAAFATSCSLEETPYSITSEKLGPVSYTHLTLPTKLEV